MASNAFHLIAGLGLTILLQVTPAFTQTLVEQATYGDWERTCAEGGECILSQANADPETDDIRMRTEISVVSDSQILMSVVVPDTVMLTEGPWLTVDGIYVGELNYIRCSQGCVARVLFTPEQFRLVANGNRGAITVTAAGQRIGIVVSFDGLAEGLVTLRDHSGN